MILFLFFVESFYGDGLIVVSEIFSEECETAAIRSIFRYGEAEVNSAVIVKLQIIDRGIGDLAGGIYKSTVLIDDQSL